MKLSIQEIIAKLKLQPHPEGGFFREVYKSKGIITKDNLDEAFEGDRNFSTSIYFLLTSQNFSAFHRIKQDEIWHFYLGSPVTIHVIDKKGNYSANCLGIDFQKGELPQFVVPAGNWFAADVTNDNSYSLVGCTVSPGFDFRDFELADRTKLMKTYPQYSDVIQKHTR